MACSDKRSIQMASKTIIKQMSQKNVRKKNYYFDNNLKKINASVPKPMPSA